MPAKVNIQIVVDDVSLPELEELRQKIENYLISEPDAQLTRFSYTEE